MSLANLSVAPEINDLDSVSFILDRIEPAFDLGILSAKLGPSSKKIKDIFQNLVGEAAEKAKPKAAFKICRVNRIGDEATSLDDAIFNSRLLNSNLSGRGLAFAFVATEGLELAGWAKKLSGVRQALAWNIRYAALKLAEKKTESFIRATMGLEQLSVMNPGALKYWPREEQWMMFSLLHPLPGNIGIKLRTNLWMEPDLSSSGIFFETNSKFYNCQFCSLAPCEHRKATYQGPWAEEAQNSEG